MVVEHQGIMQQCNHKQPPPQGLASQWQQHQYAAAGAYDCLLHEVKHLLFLMLLLH